MHGPRNVTLSGQGTKLFPTLGNMPSVFLPWLTAAQKRVYDRVREIAPYLILSRPFPGPGLTHHLNTTDLDFIAEEPMQIFSAFVNLTNQNPPLPFGIGLGVPSQSADPHVHVDEPDAQRLALRNKWADFYFLEIGKPKPSGFVPVVHQREASFKTVLASAQEDYKRLQKDYTDGPEKKNGWPWWLKLGAAAALAWAVLKKRREVDA